MELIKYFISTSCITAAIVFIGKLAVGKMFDGMVETYKYKLNTELEEFKVKQQKLLEEYKITYSKLHEDRANIIVELYKKLVKMEYKIQAFVQWSNMAIVCEDGAEIFDKENLKESIDNIPKEMFDEFSEFIDVNDIFFNDDLVVLLRELNDLLSTVRVSKDLIENELEKGELEQEAKDNIKLVHILIKIRSIKKELQSEFRNLLGVNQ